MKITVFCATLLCLELASSYPFPEPLPSYYGSYKPVGVPEQRVISQPIQIPNLAHSQKSELAYQQQQLAYLQQENLRRQNYENLLRNQEQVQLNQRIANHLSIPSQPLTTVRDPYISSIPLQRPIQPQYEAPITQQYYQNQQFTEPYQTVEPPMENQVQNHKPQPVAEPASPAQNYQYNQQYQSVPQYYKAQNVVYNPRIQQALATTPLKKRYLVLHPNGTVEHIDKIEHIVQRYPNYILVNAGDLPKPKEAVTPEPVQPVAPLKPGVVANEIPDPVALVAVLTPVVRPTPGVQSIVPTTPSPPDALPPTILTGTVPGPKPTVPPPTGPTTTSKSVTAPTALPPQPLSTTLAPPPFVKATATAVWPPVDPGTTTPLPPTSTVNPTVTPLADSNSTTSCVTTETPTTTPSIVTATATVGYPPPSDAISTTPTPTDPTVTSPSVTETATEVYCPTTPTPEVTTENPVTPAPVANVTDIEVDSQSPEVTTSTNVISVENQSDANATITKSAELTRPDLPFENIPAKPIVWFRSTDIDFFDKLTSGNETFDIVYFFNIPREPRVLKDTKTTIHANGTVVEEKTETIYDDEDAPPRVVKTTKVTNPDDSQPKT